MLSQEHNGSGDNVAGNKYENIIHSIQTRDLESVTDNIMRNICYRDLCKAREILDVLSGINALELDVQLLLKALNVKVELINGSDIPSKTELLRLLQKNTIPCNIKDVVTSILIDLESRSYVNLARERYSDLTSVGLYVKEVFYERLASKKELDDIYQCSNTYDLSEQELTGLVRGSLRVEDFNLAFELAKLLHAQFTSSNSEITLLLTESCLLSTHHQHKHYVSLSKKEKDDVDRLITQLLASFTSTCDDRHIATLINLLILTHFSDERLYGLGELHIDKVRTMSPRCAELIEQPSIKISDYKDKFELISDSLSLEQFAHLDYALQNKQIKITAINQWVDCGGEARTGDDYIDSFIDLYLRASVCSRSDIEGVHLLDEKAQQFLELDSEKFTRIVPHAILRLCERFIELELPLYSVKYLSPFLSDEAWASPFFECYLTALFASEKFDLFLSKVKHLASEDKTELIHLREAQVFDRLNKFELSIDSTRAAIKIAPNNPYAWYLLLRVSRAKGLIKKELKNILFEIPNVIFLKFDESKVQLVNEIATYIDINFADRVLVDWFAQDPTNVATALTQVHINSLSNRLETTNNPYVQLHCCDGVTYTDGFEKSTRLLARDVSFEHPILLNIDSPLGKTLNLMQEGTTSGDYTMLERLPPYVAAYRCALKIRHEGNDGTDTFKMYTVPFGEDSFIPYIKQILERHSPDEKMVAKALQNPSITLAMRGHYTNPGNPIQGAITHLLSSQSSQHMRLFNSGEERPVKVIIDAYTATYLALMGFSSSIANLNLELIFCQQTRNEIESWIKNISREDYMSLGVSRQEVYRVTSEDIQRDFQELIQDLQILLEHSKVEVLKPSDTPEYLVKIRGIVDETIYSTFQLSVANNIPLLCIDHVLIALAHEQGCPAANVDSFVKSVLSSLSLRERKKSIQLNLSYGTPISIFYNDIIFLSSSKKPSDTYLVSKFVEKYGNTLGTNTNPSALSFLTEVVRNITLVAFLKGSFSNGNGVITCKGDGYAEQVFNLCCRSAMKTLSGTTAEQKFVKLIYSVIDTPIQSHSYIELILSLASKFAIGHFLDIAACGEALTSLQCEV